MSKFKVQKSKVKVQSEDMVQYCRLALNNY